MSKGKGIEKTTLVSRMDIGCDCNAMVLMNKGGEVVGRYPRIYNTRKGFDYFVKVEEEFDNVSYPTVLTITERPKIISG